MTRGGERGAIRYIRSMSRCTVIDSKDTIDSTQRLLGPAKAVGR